MNKKNIVLLNDWLDFYQEVYGHLNLKKSKNVMQAKNHWNMISHDKSSIVFENTQLKKTVMMEGDEVIGFFPHQEFAFFVHDESGRVQVEITDLEYFNGNHYRSDWHLSQVVVTPDFLDEACEGSFDSSESIKATRQALLDLGFVEDPGFSNAMKSIYY